jgi:hypothetical protein
MLKKLFPITYETPNGATGGATPPAQPTPTPQPQGQGQPGQDGFRSTFFPNVPDEHWQLMEPHLQNVNKHVTQLQQRYAPFNSYTPEAVQGLARFAAAFDQDPVGQWMTLARALQGQGRLDPDLDLDHLEGLLNGTAQQEFDPNMDPRDQEIAELKRQVEEMNGWRQKTEQTTRNRTEDAALKKALGWMREQLKAGGLDEKLLTDQRLIAQFVGHGGNAQAAVQDALEYRTAILGGVVPDPNQPKSRELKLPNGAPKVPAERRAKTGANRRGMFKDVSDAAEQYMARANQS